MEIIKKIIKAGFMVLLLVLMAMSCKKDDTPKPPDNNTDTTNHNPPPDTITPGTFTGYAYSTTNWDDGWSSTIKDDWVEITKQNVKILLHYPVLITDEMRPQLVVSCFQLMALNRYTVNNAVEFQYDPGNFPYYLMQAEVVDNATGQNKLVTFLAKPVNGTAYCMEIITADNAELDQYFQSMEQIEAMFNYNKFAIGPNDLIGKWEEGSGAFAMYYYVVSGNYAGMSITVGHLKYRFINNRNYEKESQAVINNQYIIQTTNGLYTTGNWEINTTDDGGQTTAFDAWFEAVKGGRILHIVKKQYTSEHYQLGKMN